MPGPVERWLETFMCKQYADTFEAYGFKTLQSVCQLQLPQLQAMGVAQEHCEMILDNVHVLRQSLFAGSNKHNNSVYNISPPSIRTSRVHAKRRGTMNHYQEDMYGPGNQGNRMPGYMNQGTQGMVGMAQNMSGYPASQGHGNYSSHGQQGQIVSGHQVSYSDMYQSHSTSQQYIGQSYNSGGSYSQGQGQFGNQSGSYGLNQGNTGYSSGQQQNAAHHHMRHSGTSVKNPQEVANSILQMAVSSYLPNQTVQVPLSKHRSAPYHVPKSPHYNMSGRSNSPPIQQMPSNRHFVYPNSSPHHPARTSPISPAAMPLHSPVSHHSGQSIPSSSPRSIHSPTHCGPGSGCGSVRSPISAPSPAEMRSPCTVQSPASLCSPAPINQQLHVTVSSGQQIYGGHIQSPQQKIPTHYSPKTNPISPPASQLGSPYTSISSIHSSPAQVEPYTSPPVRQNYISDTSQDTKEMISQPATNNPLQSLQKLCMLPETQVIDPKSVVNDACLPSPNSCDNPKNFNTDADPQNICGNGESASNSQSHECVDGEHCEGSKSSDSSHKSNSDNEKVNNNLADQCAIQKNDVSDSENVSKQNCDEEHDADVKKDLNIDTKNEVRVQSVKGELVKANKAVVHVRKECENRFKKHLLNGDITSDDKILGNCLDKVIGVNKESLKSKVPCDKTELLELDISPKSALTKPNDILNHDKLDKNHIPDSQSKTVTSEKNVSKSSDKSLNGKIRHKSNSSVHNSSDDESLSKAGNKCRTRIRKTRSLRGVPARIANCVYNHNSDSDGSDYQVRKDIGSTYSRQERETIVMNKTLTPKKSRDSFDDINKKLENHTDDENVISEQNESVNSVNKNPKSNMAFDGNHRGKLENSSVKSAEKENITSVVSNPGNHDNPGDENDCIILSGDSENEPQNKTKVTKNKNNPPLKSSNSKSPSYNKRKRRKSSPVKYSDVYYGDDFALDSEEEIEFEKKNKRNRKSKQIAKQDFDENKELDFVYEYEGVDVHQVSQHSDDDDECDDNENTENYTPQVHKTTGILEPNKSELSEKASVKKKKRGRPLAKNARTSCKSKGKIKKLENSKCKKKSFERDSFENMQLRKTMDLLKKNKGKKKVDTCDKIPGPFIRVRNNDDSINTCLIVNQPDEENTASDKKAKKQKAASLSVSTVHMSRLPSEKSICVPSSSLTEDENWNCALCGKHSSYKFLGDLFGPYYVEGKLPSPNQESNFSLLDSKGKRKKSQDETPGRRTKYGRRSSELFKPREVWVHEDCVAWSDGVLLIGPKIYGLDEATQIASSMMCSACKEKGAMMGCLHKGCSQKFHSYCAVETGCYLDEENFSLLCPKHKDKKLRVSDASTSKL